MRRLVCVVEGHGEQRAVPVLCNRVMRELLGVDDWFVDEQPVRQPRSRLVDEQQPSRDRKGNTEGMARALALAPSRAPDGILVLCDADDDCVAAWGPSAPTKVVRGGRSVPVRGVMASREFESWILWGYDDAQRSRARAKQPERAPRDAKKALGVLVEGYAPTTHQLECTRRLELHTVWARSDSFDKFVRSVAELVGSGTRRPTADR